MKGEIPSLQHQITINVQTQAGRKNTKNVNKKINNHVFQLSILSVFFVLFRV